MTGGDPIWRRMSVGAATELLCERHGADKARKAAIIQQMEARRARSRKRFDFWVAVATEIGPGPKSGRR